MDADAAVAFSSWPKEAMVACGVVTRTIRDLQSDPYVVSLDTLSEGDEKVVSKGDPNYPWPGMNFMMCCDKSCNRRNIALNKGFDVNFEFGMTTIRCPVCKKPIVVDRVDLVVGGVGFGELTLSWTVKLMADGFITDHSGQKTFPVSTGQIIVWPTLAPDKGEGGSWSVTSFKLKMDFKKMVDAKYEERKREVQSLQDAVLRGEQVSHRADLADLQNTLNGGRPLCFASDAQFREFQEACRKAPKAVKVWALGSAVHGWSMNPEKPFHDWSKSSDLDLCLSIDEPIEQLKRHSKYPFIDKEIFYADYGELGTYFAGLSDEWKKNLGIPSVTFKLLLDAKYGDGARRIV